MVYDGETIVAGLGVIENDFHDRKDLKPNVCAVWTNEEYRNRGIAGKLLNMVVEDTPQITLERDDGWRGFRIQGVLDFSLIGILSKLSGILAEHKIGIFAVSTYNTDYILVKENNYERALTILASEGYTVI